jgi:hypothetical protein
MPEVSMTPQFVRKIRLDGFLPFAPNSAPL